MWRIVEAQHCVSTMKLVDTAAEQEVLENLLEETKPPVPPGAQELDFLLFTPFRYGAAYPKGSRFRRAGFTLGIFYGSASTETAMTEMAFYRLLFYAESPDTPLPKNPAEYSAFAVHVVSDRALDLTRPPLNKHAKQWTELFDYSNCQALADNAREIGVTTISYLSVRDPKCGTNYAILDPRAFAQPAPVARQTWRMQIRLDGILAKCESPRASLSFKIDDFKKDSRLLPLLKKAA